MYGYPRNQRGYPSNYRYSQPSAQEYESFFNPIPLDFLVGQLEKSQSQYDTGYATALSAKDQFGGVKVDSEDIGYKNQLVNDFVNNTDKMVKEQYGGDWGRASKAIARSVSEVRNNDFWNAAANAQAERRRVQELSDKYGAKAMIFGDDMRGKSAIGDNGVIRKFKPADVVEQGKWGDTARRIFSSIQPEKYQQYGLTQSEMEGYLKTKQVSEITKQKLEALANDDMVQQVFRQEHPEFTRGFNEYDQSGRLRYGIEGENLKDATARTLLGNILPAVNEQSEVNYRDGVNTPNAKSGVTKTSGGGASGITTANVGPSFTLSPKRVEGLQENINSLTNEKVKLDEIKNRTPEQNKQLDIITRQLEDENRNFDYMFNSVQRNPKIESKVTELYNDYKKNSEGWDMSQEEFSEKIKYNFKNNIWEKIHPGSRFSTDENTKKNEAENARNMAINDAVKELRSGFKKYGKENPINANVRIITGTEGSDKLATYAGNANKMLTDTFKENQLDYTTAIDGQQIESVLGSDKRYKGKIDRSKTTVSIGDGSINGKFVQLASFYGKDGKPLGAEYIVPRDQEQARKHIVNTAMELMSGATPDDPDYKLGYNMYLNTVYGPSIQEADIHTKTTGEFKGIDYGGSGIHFERVEGSTSENPMYAFYIYDKNGKKDYFEDEESGKKLTAEDEDGIKLRLEDFQKQYAKVVESDEVNKSIGLFSTPKETVNFFDKLGASESRNNYSIIGPVIPGRSETDRALGKYQFMPGTLRDLGYKGITYEKFKDDPSIFPPEEQEKAIVKFTKQNADSLSTVIKNYVGKVDPNTNVTITKEGILAAAHLGGPGGVRKYLESGFRDTTEFNPSDGNTKISDYLAKFSK